MYKLYHGNCIIEMDKIPDKSVDMILADLPYGTTACKWDSVIPLIPLWNQYKRIIKGHGCIALFSTQPFTSVLVTSNLEMFKYSWVWKKTRPGGFVSAKLRPLKDMEDICIFSTGTTANKSNTNMPYNPQGVKPGIKWSRPSKYKGSDGISYSRPSHKTERETDGSGYPREIIEFSNPNKVVLHPTEKPVPLLEYLIRTYTDEGMTVLDNTMGSGSTIVAANNTNRNSIGIELYPLPDKPVDKKTNPNYFFLAQERIERELNRPKQVELV